MTSPWTDDWRNRVHDALLAKGHNSFLEYARANERSTFYQLAEALAGEGLAPVQMEILLREECGVSENADYFPKSALVRQLHHYVPNGIRSHGKWKLVRGLSSWVAMVGTTPAKLKVFSKIADVIQSSSEIPDDWVPESTNDPILSQVFDRSARVEDE